MRLVLALAAITIAFTNLACAHAVRIESAPGAEILVDGRSIGTAPATYHETTGTADSVQITARLRGREKTVEVRRDSVDFAPVGASAAAGAAGCMAASAVSVVSLFVFMPCAVVSSAAAWGSLLGAPIAGWFLFGHKLPDTVRVELDHQPPAVAMTNEQPF